jgi:hypothetical protein
MRGRTAGVRDWVHLVLTDPWNEGGESPKIYANSVAETRCIGISVRLVPDLYGSADESQARWRA